MDYDRIISISNDIAIYRHGNKRIKVFINGSDFLKALEECSKTQRIKELTNINVPQIYSVGLNNNLVEIFSEFIEGETLAQELKGNLDNANKIIRELIELQTQINGNSNVLNCTHKHFSQNQTSCLNTATGLCHGELTPENVVRTPSGRFYVLSWGSAFEGDIRLDVALTYYRILYSYSKQIAETYLDEYLKVSKFTKENILEVSSLALEYLVNKTKVGKKQFFSDILENNKY